MLLRAERIGGAFVRRGFSSKGEYLKTGTHLTRADVLSFPSTNRQALLDGGYIEVYPPGSPSLEGTAAPDSQRFVASAGFGNFNVYEGRKLNSVPLTKAEARALAGLTDDAAAEPTDPPPPNPPVEEPPKPE
jgi:hypothetical protein